MFVKSRIFKLISSNWCIIILVLPVVGKDIHNLGGIKGPFFFGETLCNLEIHILRIITNY